MTVAAMNQEANAFAMELLMPAEWLLEDAKNLDLADDTGLSKLAKKYAVSPATMAYRLGVLRSEKRSGE